MIMKKRTVYNGMKMFIYAISLLNISTNMYLMIGDTFVNIITNYNNMYINLMGVTMLIGFDYILDKQDKEIIKNGVE
jgi:FMN phosphatase YigB (HAD superfamily)